VQLDSKIPAGPISEKWTSYKFDRKLVNPANRRKYDIIVVGTGLAGASAAATLGEQGYNVKAFTFHDSPRRAHSIAAQGGINAAKNYKGDGDSIHRLFYDTVKGGDFRAREANVYRLAEESVNIIDQMTAQGVPFAREYGGLLDNRSFGGAQVSRTFYARGQTGQQLLLGAYQQLARQVGLGKVKLYNRTEMVDVVVVDGRAAGIVVRDLLSGEITSHSAHAVVLATGGYSNVFFLSTNAMACNVTAAWRAHRKGAAFANPCYTQIHPTCIPQSDDFQSKLTLMSESLRNDGRIWVPKDPNDNRPPDQIPEEDRDYYLERRYPSFGNLAPRDIASRAALVEVAKGKGVGPLKNGVYLDFSDAISRLGEKVIEERYGNLFEMYERITDESPYKVPMRIYPAPHYTMGGLWVDYELMTTVPGLYCLGEANFSDHGANRLGASALMQGLADGYFVLPNTISNYLAPVLGTKPVPTDHPEFKAAEAAAADRFREYLSIGGTRSPDSFHMELGKIMLENCGMERTKESLEKALREIPALHEEFRKDLRVTGGGDSLNQTLEKAGRVDDFFELAQVMCLDALTREESCGGHFRAEHQTEEGEAQRDDENFAHVAAWEWTGDALRPNRHTEPLTFENVQLAVRSYK
jgi:succinate dehydrogenase / fumarate reductase flavoprotein subunit